MYPSYTHTFFLSLIPFTKKGIVESLHAETLPLGIRTLLLEPGRFCTKLLSPANMKISENDAIADYRDFSQSQRQGLAEEDSNQPGNPKKFVQVVIDLVRREGVFKDKERDVGLRLPLGNDAFEEISRKVESMRKLLREWEGVIRSTDFDDA